MRDPTAAALKVVGGKQTCERMKEQRARSKREQEGEKEGKREGSSTDKQKINRQRCREGIDDYDEEEEEECGYEKTIRFFFHVIGPVIRFGSPALVDQAAVHSTRSSCS